MKQNKRLFLGLRPNQDWLNALEGFIKKQEADFRWIPSENFHVTVLFIGSFPVPYLNDLVNELHSFYRRMPSGHIAFERYAYVPNRKPQMLWAQGKREEQFSTLEKSSLSLLKSFYEKRDMPFTISLHHDSIPHITLSRLKNRKPSPLRLENIDFPEPFPYKKVVLYESKPGPGSSKYFVLDEFDLLEN